MLRLAALKEQSDISGIATDFDGTISTIRFKQIDVKINKRSKYLLAKLACQYPLVSIISGREVKQLSKMVQLDNLFYIGNHGAEYLLEDNYRVEQVSLKTTALIANIYETLKAFQNEYELDYKKYSLTIHYRSSKNPEKAERHLKYLLDHFSNPKLNIQKGRMCFNISIKGINKGKAVEYLVRRYKLKNFLYIGDDKTDTDAFKAMKRLELQGLKILRVALISKEAPKTLVKNSDLIIHSIKEVNALLQELL